MARHGSQKRRLGLAIATAIALGACVGTPTQAPKTTKGARSVPTETKGTAAPSESPVSSTAPSSAPSSSPSASPSSVPSASPSASPSALPSAPAPRLNETHQKLVPALSEKLLALTQIGFAQSRSNLVANNSAGIVSQNGAALVSNHGAGVIANNGSNVIGNNGSGYRVAQATPPTTIATEPQEGETLVSDRSWPDGRRTRWFAAAFANTLTDYRTANLESNGQPVYQFTKKLLSKDTAGEVYEKSNLRLFKDGSFNEYSRYTSTFDASGNLIKLVCAENVNQFRDAKLGLELDIEALSFDVTATTGSFRYHYKSLGLVEHGTLANVRTTTTNKLVVEMYDPLAAYDGESKVEKEDGTLLFTKVQKSEGSVKQREYDLQGGMVLKLAEKSLRHYEGDLFVNGQAEAKAALVTQTDGSVIISVTFPEDLENPLKIGYGVLSGVAEPPAASPRPVWRVKTVAGATTAGYVNGSGTTARFSQPTAMVASRVTPGRFYLADKENHRIRVIDVASDGKFTVGNYAGDGTAGYQEGPKETARFFRPFGIAVGPEDALYVTDLGNHRVRKIAPDGTVSLVAGSAKGHADGQGNAAQLDLPAGIARAADGTLYVLDQGTSCLRAITPAGTVSTLAGLSGTEGHIDGQGDAARFFRPLGLVLGPDDALYVADLDRYVRKVTRTGLVSTVVGSGVTAKAHLDGAPLEGGISLPYSLCFGAEGTLYIGSYNVRYLTPDGKLKTYAGDTMNGYKDGTNEEAQFENIFGMVMGADGTLYVVESNRIRAIVPPQ